MKIKHDTIYIDDKTGVFIGTFSNNTFLYLSGEVEGIHDEMSKNFLSSITKSPVQVGDIFEHNHSGERVRVTGYIIDYGAFSWCVEYLIDSPYESTMGHLTLLHNATKVEIKEVKPLTDDERYKQLMFPDSSYGIGKEL